jgi:acetyl esterase/lipase
VHSTTATDETRVHPDVYAHAHPGGKHDPALNGTAPVADVVADAAAKGSWRVSPLLAPDWKLRTLPPVLLLHATTEVLVDEATEFAQRYDAAVRRSGSSKSSSSSSSSGLTVQQYSHTLHGFFARDLTHGSASLADAAAFIRNHC